LISLVLEDALKIGFTRDTKLINSFLRKVETLLMPLPYGKWVTLTGCKIRLQAAGHILGSAFVEIKTGRGPQRHTTVFSGDLGAPYTPLLPAPKSPYRADTLILESTYGDKNHPGRKERVKTLQKRIESCFKNRGTTLIPAFSIGRTQELPYEIEQIIHREGKRLAAEGTPWEDLDIIVDSPLSNRFSEVYKALASCWDGEAKRRVQRGRHPLSCYSAHAGQDNLLRFIKGIRKKPSLIRLVHGEPYAQEALQEKISVAFPEIAVERGSEFKGKLS
jgi:metallo-beta-lactamase family protein